MQAHFLCTEPCVVCILNSKACNYPQHVGMSCHVMSDLFCYVSIPLVAFDQHDVIRRLDNLHCSYSSARHSHGSGLYNNSRTVRESVGFQHCTMYCSTLHNLYIVHDRTAPHCTVELVQVCNIDLLRVVFGTAIFTSLYIFGKCLSIL